MFSQYRDQLVQLKAADPHFAELCDKHDALDQRIHDMENGVQPATHLEIEALKKEKLLLKDKVWAILKNSVPG